MDKEILLGDIVKSNYGHDKNRLYIVLSIDKNGYFAIIDGKYRGLKKPKIKNPKHLSKIAHDESILTKINSGLSTDTEIYKLIKAYQKSIKE